MVRAPPLVAALLALALCVSPRAFAEDAPATPATLTAPAPPAAPAAPPKLVPIALGAFSGALHASYRVLGWTQPGIQLGRRDTNDPIEVLGKKTWLEHRLRLGAELKRDDLELRFEADVVNGLLAALPGGDVLPQAALPPGGAPRPDLADPQRNRAWGQSPSSFALRELALRWKTRAGLLTFGATTFNFGSGMLANGATAALDAELGDQRWGDRVVRLSFATRPLSLALGADAPDLTIVLGLDVVLQDETAQLFRPLSDWGPLGAIQDKAFGGILGLQHKTGSHALGGFVTRRSIRPPDSPVLVANVTVPFETDLQVWAFDLAGDLKHRPGEGPLELFGAFEGALALGDTNRVRNAACPGQEGSSRCKILQGGLVARAGVRGALVGFELLGGFVSGDADPFDARIDNFKLDRDFKVGLILFDEVLGWQSAASVRRALDPLLTNAASPGIELVSTNGAVTNALFVQPTLKVQPLASLQLVASVLWARAPQAVVDPYWTLKAGALTNSFGQAPGQSYGLELDAGVNWRHELLPGLTAFAGLAGGLFLPGDAFVVDAAGNKMDSIVKVKARAAVQF